MFEQQMDNNSRANKRGGLLIFVPVIVFVIGTVMAINTTADVEQAQQNMAEMIQDAQVNLEQAEQSRQQFMTDLQNFEQTLEPSLLDVGMQAYAREEVAELIDKKQAAVDAFGAGDYQAAVAQLASIVEPTQVITQRWDHAFEQAYSTAVVHFEQGDVDRANLALTNALKLKPSHVIALALKQRLDVLPQVQQLLSKAKVAQVEQKLALEASLLQQVIALDSERTDLNKRITEIQQVLQEQYFTTNIAAGIRAIDSGDVQSAKAELNKAKAIAPSRNEVKLLVERINQYEQSAAQQRVIAAVELAIAEDDWQQVFVKSVSGLKKYPANARLKLANQQAKQLLALERQVEKYLAKPERLSDKALAVKARRWLNANMQTAKTSQSIIDKMQQLKTQLAVADKPVAVTLRSDGKTKIIVVGKGHVGKIKSYQISLPPGQYVLEGSRKGYRSVRVNLEVTPAIINQQVSVICNERI